MSRILRIEGVREARNDLVRIGLVEVARVDGEGAVPLAGVEAAVGTLGHVVLEQDVGVEEVARAVVSVLVDEVLLVEGGLGSAGGGADGGVKGSLVVELHAVVRVGVGRRVDGGGEGDGGAEAGDGGSRADGAELGVAVAAGDDNVEGFTAGVLGSTPLAGVGSGGGADGVAEEGALHVGECGRVRAVGGGVDRGIALVVDVEAVAELLRVAEGSAGVDIVFAAVDGAVGQVADLLTAGLEVLEALDVAARGASSLSLCAEDTAGVEVGRNAAVSRKRSVAVQC